MAQNIINQNLDQYGLQYGEGLNPYAPDVQIDNMPTNRGYTNFDGQEVGIINTDIGNQMADLSKGQMKALNNPITKFNIMDSKDYNTILNDVGFRAQDIEGKPPTKQNIIDYYNGTYKPQASLNNGIMENISNLFFSPAAAAESEIRPDNNLNSFGLNAPEFSITDLLQQDVNKDIYNGYRPDQPRSFRSMTQDQNIYEPEKLSLFQKGKDLASSGILKAGKTGMNLFNLVKNNNPMGFLTSGIGKLFGGLDQFDTLSPADQQFILSQQDSVGNNKDPFGINIRSGFGNYADYVRNKGRFAKGNRGDYYKSLIPGLELAESETRQREINKAIALEEEMARREEDRIRSQSPTGSMDYGSSGYEGMSDAASQQEMDEGGRGSRG